MGPAARTVGGEEELQAVGSSSGSSQRHQQWSQQWRVSSDEAAGSSDEMFAGTGNDSSNNSDGRAPVASGRQGQAADHSWQQWTNLTTQMVAAQETAAKQATAAKEVMMGRTATMRAATTALHSLHV